jgi:hypothetical protein
MNTDRKKKPAMPKKSAKKTDDVKVAAPKPAPAGEVKPAAKPQPAAKKRSIRQIIIELITANPGASNDEMIAAARKEFPASAFKATHAAWYRSQAKRGLLTGTKIEIPSAKLRSGR